MRQKETELSQNIILIIVPCRKNFLATIQMYLQLSSTVNQTSMFHYNIYLLYIYIYILKAQFTTYFPFSSVSDSVHPI